jgi:CHAT domain-containing protein
MRTLVFLVVASGFLVPPLCCQIGPMRVVAVKSLIDGGDYDEALKYLRDRAVTDSVINNWDGWIKSKSLIAKCHVFKYEPILLASVVDQVEGVVKSKHVFQAELLKEYYAIKSMYLRMIGDFSANFLFLDSWFYYFQLAKNRSHSELVSIYEHYLYLHNYFGDTNRSEYFFNRLDTILWKSQESIVRSNLINSYLQMGDYFAKKMVPSNESKILENKNKALKFYRLARSHLMTGNKFFEGRVDYYFGTLYFRLADVREYLNQKRLATSAKIKSDLYFDKAIKIYTSLNSEAPYFLVNLYFSKGLLFSNDSGAKSLSYYSKALSLLFKDHSLRTQKDSTRVLFNYPFKSTALYLQVSKARVLRYIYHQSGNSLFLRQSFNTFDLASKLSEEILVKYNSKSPYQILEQYNILPFRDAIGVASLLYLQTKDENLKWKIFEYSESSKYAEIVKSFLMSNKKNSKRTGSVAFEKEKLQLREYIEKNLNSKSCIVEYVYDREDNLFCLAVTKSKIDLIKIPMNKEELSELILEFRTSIERNDLVTYRQVAHELYKLLIDPIISVCPNNLDEIVIVPVEDLSFIPFDALIDQQCESSDYRDFSYLVKKYRISQQMALQLIIRRPVEKTQEKQFGFVGFGIDLILHRNRLPFSQKSVHYFEKEFEGKFFSNTNATLENFKKFSVNSALLYLSTHSEINADDPNNNKLFFQTEKSSGQGNYLSLELLHGMKIGADLVILSACETALGVPIKGEGVMSFERAFVLSGAKSVLSTLWKTDDLGSFQMLTAFVEKLSKNESKFEAMSMVKREYLEAAITSEDANPYYWASYKLSGLDGPIVLQRKHKYVSQFLLGIGLVLLMDLSLLSLLSCWQRIE